MHITPYLHHHRDAVLDLSIRAWQPVFAVMRRGVGTALLEHACSEAPRAGMGMVMVETGGDAGHAPARAQYESAGFTR